MKSTYLLIGVALSAGLVVAAMLFVRPGRPDARIVATLTDVGATNVHTWSFPSGSMEPHTYTDAYAFNIDGDYIGGRLFRCATKQDCDTLVAALEANQPPQGPYMYQSASGTTVVSVERYIEVRAAVRYYDAIRDLP